MRVWRPVRRFADSGRGNWVARRYSHVTLAGEYCEKASLVSAHCSRLHVPRTFSCSRGILQLENVYNRCLVMYWTLVRKDCVFWEHINWYALPVHLLCFRLGMLAPRNRTKLDRINEVLLYRFKMYICAVCIQILCMHSQDTIMSKQLREQWYRRVLSATSCISHPIIYAFMTLSVYTAYTSLFLKTRKKRTKRT